MDREVRKPRNVQDKGDTPCVGVVSKRKIGLCRSIENCKSGLYSRRSFKERRRIRSRLPYYLTLGTLGYLRSRFEGDVGASYKELNIRK